MGKSQSPFRVGDFGVALALGLGLAIPNAAQSPPPRDLTQFSLEDLMNVQVTSVSKKEQKLAKTGAAIFVITHEDIRHVFPPASVTKLSLTLT